MRLSYTQKPNYRRVQLVYGNKYHDGYALFIHKDDMDGKDNAERILKYIAKNQDWNEQNKENEDVANHAFESLEDIPLSAPLLSEVEKSKSNKVVKMLGLWFFVLDKKSGSTIYSIDIGKKIGYAQNRALALNWTARKIPKIKSYINDPSNRVAIDNQLAGLSKSKKTSTKLSELKSRLKKLITNTNFVWTHMSKQNALKPYCKYRKGI